MVQTRSAKKKNADPASSPAATSTRTSTRTAPAKVGSPIASSRKAVQRVRDKISSPAARAQRAQAVKSAVATGVSGLLDLEDFTQDEYDTDEYDYGEEGDDSELSDASVVTTASGRKARNPLAWTLQQTLLKDIQDRGGIHKFGLKSTQALRNLCDSRPELYQTRGHPLRKRIRKKVYDWRKMYMETPSDWCDVLVSFKITQPARKHQARPPVGDKKLSSSPAAAAAPSPSPAAAAPLAASAAAAPLAASAPSPQHSAAAQANALPVPGQNVSLSALFESSAPPPVSAPKKMNPPHNTSKSPFRMLWLPAHYCCR